MKGVIYLPSLRKSIRNLIQMLIQNTEFGKHIKLTIENLNINDIDEIYYAYFIEHNKEYDYYLVKCELKIIFNDK